VVDAVMPKAIRDRRDYNGRGDPQWV
jgi:hypothetical protein